MDISIGADVIGTGGKLGEVHRVIVDARSDHVTDVVVKHGSLFGKERIVPLSYVSRVEEGRVYLDLDEKGLEAMNGFTEDRYRAPDPDYSGPPGWDRGGFLIDTTVAAGSAGGLGPLPAKPLGFPGGEQAVPDLMQRPSVSPGTPVLDADGEKIGEVHEFAATADTGVVTRLTVRSGFIFKQETEIPVEWVSEISDDGILLHVPKSRVEELAGSERG